MRILNLLLLLLISCPSFAQIITGQITDTKKAPISFATVYSKETMEGTLANADGIFNLQLSSGNHHICIKHMGHKTQLIPITIAQDTLQLDVSLQAQVFAIPEARILASGEDPAYGIMRKAIALSAYYLKQVSEYSCQVYLKGTGVIDKIPRILKKQLKKDGLEEGKYFVTENISNIRFSLPDNVEQEVLSIRSSGQESGAQPMDFITLSLYHDIQGIPSPLGKEALSIYNFRHDGSFYDQDYLVHKIHVEPKSKGALGYRGYLYITEGFWHLHSTQLTLERNMFTIDINQVYAPNDNYIWMPISHNFQVHAKTMGFKVEYTYVASVKKYALKWNTDINHDHFNGLIANYFSDRAIADSVYNHSAGDSATYALINKESISRKEGRKLKRQIKKQTKSKPSLEVKDNFTLKDSAQNRSQDYWDKMRPVTLTTEELVSFRDTLILSDSLTAKDSSYLKTPNRFRWHSPLTGYSYQSKHAHFSSRGVINLLGWSYNTVDGPAYRHKFNYQYHSEKHKILQLKGMLGYAFSRKDPLAKAELRWKHNPLKLAKIHLEGGSESTPFHQHIDFGPFSNELSTLFYKENLSKYHEKNYLTGSYEREITNGLTAKISGKFSYNKQLTNHCDFYFTNPWNKEFTINRPEGISSEKTNSHHNTTLAVNFSYTPQQYYRIRDGIKTPLYSHWPTFTLTYQQGFTHDIYNETDQYNWLKSTIEYSLHNNFWGNFQWSILGAWAPDSPKYLAQYQHIATQPFFLTTNASSQVFKGLPLYKYSAKKYALQLNMQWQKGNFLITRLPWLNKSFASEHLAFRFLKTDPLNQPWMEMAYGINNLFLLGNAELFTAFKGKKHEISGIRIVLPISSDNSAIVIGN